MIAIIYHLCTGLATLIALFDWRIGLILCVLFDGIRDPVRKVTPNYPLIISLTVVAIWSATFLGAIMQQPEHCAWPGNSIRRVAPWVGRSCWPWCRRRS